MNEPMMHFTTPLLPLCKMMASTWGENNYMHFFQTCSIVATKARACKVADQERKPGSERKCEGMNPHTLKGASTLGVRVPMDSRMFKE
jgi:hypothetical protein